MIKSKKSILYQVSGSGPLAGAAWKHEQSLSRFLADKTSVIHTAEADLYSPLLLFVSL